MPDTSFTPTCGLAGCTATPIVQWRRRPTAEEALALPALAGSNATVSVFGCGPHALDLTHAAHVHQATCTAPNAATLPGCDCTPEPLPAPEPAGGTDPSVTLPTGWVVPAQTT